MEWYGGMTQDIKARFEGEQGINFVFLQEAKANQVGKSRSKWTKREDIIKAKLLLYKIYEK